MVLIPSENVFTELITWRRENGFNYSPKEKNGIWNVISPRELTYISKSRKQNPKIEISSSVIDESKNHLNFSKELRKVTNSVHFSVEKGSSKTVGKFEPKLESVQLNQKPSKSKRNCDKWLHVIETIAIIWSIIQSKVDGLRQTRRSMGV